MLKLGQRNNLCQHICRIIFGAYLNQIYHTVFNNFPNEVISDINMLGSSMMNLILRQVNCTLTVTVHHHFFRLQTKITN
ncbi:hypothetical protein LguiB_006107 [Lonicera macranthoides]